VAGLVARLSVCRKESIHASQGTLYKGMAKNTAQLFSLFGFANLLLARRWIDDTDSQVAS